MQRLVGIFLLICFTVPVASSYLWLRYERKLVRREVKAALLKGMDQKNLVLLAFTEAEDKALLQWEHSGEFTFHSQKYDIVSQKKVGEQMHYWCWKDTKESALDSKLTELTRQAWGNNPQKDKQHKIASETVKSTPEKRVAIPLFVGEFERTNRAFFDYVEITTSATLIAASPPPEVYC
ncbi:MAG: hypothetical protein QE487_10475 [Fluviicola sp.]|nr:hypothetical protein [Fluviicola sp.]